MQQKRTRGRPPGPSPRTLAILALLRAGLTATQIGEFTSHCTAAHARVIRARYATYLHPGAPLPATV